MKQKIGISEEITKKTEKSQILKEKPNLKNKKEIRSKKIKREKKLNNISNTTNNEEDDMIIINTDSTKFGRDRKIEGGKSKNKNEDNKSKNEQWKFGRYFRKEAKNAKYDNKRI